MGKKAFAQNGNVGQQDRGHIIESLSQVVHYLITGHGQTSWHYEIIRSTGDDATVTFTNGLVQ